MSAEIIPMRINIDENTKLFIERTAREASCTSSAILIDMLWMTLGSRRAFDDLVWLASSSSQSPFASYHVRCRLHFDCPQDLYARLVEWTDKVQRRRPPFTSASAVAYLLIMDGYRRPLFRSYGKFETDRDRIANLLPRITDPARLSRLRFQEKAVRAALSYLDRHREGGAKIAAREGS